MHSILFQIGVFPLYSYGLLLAASFLIGLVLTSRRAERVGIPREIINDLALWVLAGGVAGCRLAYVLVNYTAEFKGRWLNIINPWQGGTFGIGGMNLVGGLILATLLGMAYLKWKKQPALLGADLVMPAVALGIGLTRIGCFLNGCCWGKPTPLPWGVTFPPESAAGAYQQLANCGPVLPTQLYSSAAGFLIFGLLLWLERYKKFNGFTLCLFVFLYGAKRFIIDFFRYYPAHEVHAGLTNNQYLWLGLMAFFAVLFFRLRRNNLRQLP